MGKKKPFIDKKTADTYHLFRRSTRDVGGHYDEEGNPLDIPREFTLVPTPDTERRHLQKQQEEQRQKLQQLPTKQLPTLPEGPIDQVPANPLTRIKQQLQQANLLDDYDYEQHMKPISDSGHYIPAATTAQPNLSARSQPLTEPSIQEVERQFDSIALSAACMEEDVAQALFDFNEEDFEEILDDFCLTAAQEPEDEEEGVAFDFDAHVNALIAKAKEEEKGGGKVVPKGHEWWTKQEEEFRGVKPLHRDGSDAESDDDDDEEEESHDLKVEGTIDSLQGLMGHGVVPKLAAEEEKFLSKLFYETLAKEYDSDEVGDLDDQCFDIRGEKPLEGDVGIDAAMDQFIAEQKDENLMIGTRHLPENKRKGGSSKVFVNQTLIDFNELETKAAGEDELEEEKVEDVLAAADSFLANPEVELPPEEVLIDGKSYFTMKSSNPWDCESILSTYSNLDNNPAVIDGTSRRRRRTKKKSKKPEQDIPEEEPVQILLSDKTGLPLGVLPEKSKVFDDDGLTFASSVNKGVARKKGETKEEKRARKNLVKEEKKISRIEKKMMREAIQEEFSKRATPADDVAGKTVFRYS